MNYKLQGLLTNKGWISPAYVRVLANGTVQSIDDKPEQNISYDSINGYAIPGFQNAHSHAFQYAMAGLAEIHDTKQTPDDFWSWRQAMYKLALSISPEDLEAIATQLYAEMLRVGYTEVVEFHYVHHDGNGKAYTNLAEMGERLVAAAHNAGIKLSLIPIFYKNGGFGKAPTDGQKRFISASADDYNKLFEATQTVTNRAENAQTVLGYHSLRGVDIDAIRATTCLANEGPIHIHISEQLKEIEESIAYSGKRPVEYLHENIGLTEQWQLVHATHLNTTEVAAIASTNAKAVLCPSTEGNLGDGFFRLKEYQELNGSWSIGTDSHVGLDPKEELRILDYGFRLQSHKRNTYYNPQNGDGGLFALDMAYRTGRNAMGKNHQYFEVGQPFDCVIINADHPLIQIRSLDQILSTYIYSGDATFNLGTMVNGKWVVKENSHSNGAAIANSFIKSLKSLF